MITYEDAKRIIDESVELLDEESVFVGAALGRYLTRDVIARYDSPPFANSAVDGFGRRGEDLHAERLEVVGEVKAGDRGNIRVRTGQAVRIFTGAPIPNGIAAVSMQEDCELEGDEVRFREHASAGENLRPAGDDFKAGEVVLKSGTRLNPPALGIAISAGVRDIQVGAVPTVSVLTTGTELLDPGHDLQPGKIYNSNMFSLAAAVQATGATCRMYESSDRRPVLKRKLCDAILSNMLVTSGGVSVGEYDLVKEELAAMEVEQRFWRAAIKPGKPIYFGKWHRVPVFGLPGNPSSALVTFTLFVRPAILKMMGCPDPWPKPMRARFEGESRKHPGRMEFMRGSISFEGPKVAVREAGSQGSHQLAAIAAADCLIHFPLESERLSNGEEVDVTPLTW